MSQCHLWRSEQSAVHPLFNGFVRTMPHHYIAHGYPGEPLCPEKMYIQKTVIVKKGYANDPQIFSGMFLGGGSSYESAWAWAVPVIKSMSAGSTMGDL